MDNPAPDRDVDHADVIALYGHNVAETQAVLWMRILDRLAGPHLRSSCASTRAEPPSPSWPISTWWPPVTVTEFHDRGRISRSDEMSSERGAQHQASSAHEGALPCL
jgi:hypothetical protein